MLPAVLSCSPFARGGIDSYGYDDVRATFRRAILAEVPRVDAIRMHNWIETTIGELYDPVTHTMRKTFDVLESKHLFPQIMRMPEWGNEELYFEWRGPLVDAATILDIEWLRAGEMPLDVPKTKFRGLDVFTMAPVRAPVRCASQTLADFATNLLITSACSRMNPCPNLTKNVVEECPQTNMTIRSIQNVVEYNRDMYMSHMNSVFCQRHLDPWVNCCETYRTSKWFHSKGCKVRITKDPLETAFLRPVLERMARNGKFSKRWKTHDDGSATSTRKETDDIVEEYLKHSKLPTFVSHVVMHPLIETMTSQGVSDWIEYRRLNWFMRTRSADCEIFRLAATLMARYKEVTDVVPILPSHTFLEIARDMLDGRSDLPALHWFLAHNVWLRDSMHDRLFLPVQWREVEDHFRPMVPWAGTVLSHVGGVTRKKYEQSLVRDVLRNAVQIHALSKAILSATLHALNVFYNRVVHLLGKDSSKVVSAVHEFVRYGIVVHSKVSSNQTSTLWSFLALMRRMYHDRAFHVVVGPLSRYRLCKDAMQSILYHMDVVGALTVAMIGYMNAQCDVLYLNGLQGSNRFALQYYLRIGTELNDLDVYGLHSSSLIDYVTTNASSLNKHVTSSLLEETQWWSGDMFTSVLAVLPPSAVAASQLQALEFRKSVTLDIPTLEEFALDWSTDWSMPPELSPRVGWESELKSLHCTVPDKKSSEVAVPKTLYDTSYRPVVRRVPYDLTFPDAVALAGLHPALRESEAFSQRALAEHVRQAWLVCFLAQIIARMVADTKHAAYLKWFERLLTGVASINGRIPTDEKTLVGIVMRMAMESRDLEPLNSTGVSIVTSMLVPCATILNTVEDCLPQSVARRGFAY